MLKGKNMRNCEHLVERKQKEYWANEEKIWNVLNSMTTREIALSPVGAIAQEAEVGRNTLYNHKAAYRYIVECRIQEAERKRKLQANRKNLSIINLPLGGNEMTKTSKSAIATILTALLGSTYDINKVAELLEMSKNRTIEVDTFHISTFNTDCEVEETTVADDNFVLIEGRYADDRKHDSAYHYVYLDYPEGDWRFKITVDAEGKIGEVKEICTIDHAIKIFKQEIIGEKYDGLKTMNKYAEIIEKYAVEEKGETEIRSVEGSYGKYNTEGFYVPVLNSTTVCVAYDENRNIVEVITMKGND